MIFPFAFVAKGDNETDHELYTNSRIELHEYALLNYDRTVFSRCLIIDSCVVFLNR